MKPKEGPADVFTPFSAAGRFRTLKQGSRVTYKLVQGPKGDLAKNIRQVVTAAKVAAEAEAAAAHPKTAHGLGASSPRADH